MCQTRDLATVAGRRVTKIERIAACVFGGDPIRCCDWDDPFALLSQSEAEIQRQYPGQYTVEGDVDERIANATAVACDAPVARTAKKK